MIHERSHRDDVTYTCEVCGKNFKRQDNLKQHRWLFRHTIFDIELIKEFQVNLTLTNCKCWFVPFRVSRVTFFTCAICMCNTYSIFRFKEQNKTKKKTNEIRLLNLCIWGSLVNFDAFLTLISSSYEHVRGTTMWPSLFTSNIFTYSVGANFFLCFPFSLCLTNGLDQSDFLVGRSFVTITHNYYLQLTNQQLTNIFFRLLSRRNWCLASITKHFEQNSWNDCNKTGWNILWWGKKDG